MFFAIIAVILWAVLPGPALTITVPAANRPAAQADLPWLSVRGNVIADDQNRTVLLHGFNADPLLETTMHGAPLDDTDAAMMQQSGFNVVRLPIAWSLLEPTRGHFDTSYLDKIASYVSMLNAHHLYVVIDMHFLLWSPVYGGSGAPDWAVVSGVPDDNWGPMPSWERFLSPGVNASTVAFWSNPDWQRELEKTWELVAERFRNDSGVAGYDLMNEPHSLPMIPLRFDKDSLFPWYAQTIEAIASVDPNHLYFLDNDMAPAPSTVARINASNLVYAPHVYTGALMPPDFTGDTGPVLSKIDDLGNQATQIPAALFYGEFSISPVHPLAEQWVDTVLNEFDKQHAGWAWWDWRENNGWGVRSYDGNSMNLTLLKWLARPFVAAAPVGVSTDVLGDSLLITVSSSHDPGNVLISWPEYLWGAPKLSGNCVATSAWNAALARVEITLRPGVGCQLSVSKS